MAIKYRSILTDRGLEEIEGEGSGISDEKILGETSAKVGRISGGAGVNEADNQKSVLKQHGAHLDVLNGLSDITFVDGMSCGMSEEIAYIRYWSRSGVSRNAEAIEQEAVTTVPTDRSGDLSDKISEQYGTGFNPEPPISGLSERPVNANTPVNPFKEQQTLEDLDSNNAIKLSDSLSGPLYSANTFGSTESSTPQSGSGVWQFLFNPEELQLTSGPEYNRAESWGVSDPANSGQPLSWRRNQNRKLNFGKILLHGYTFGKRVDSLEKGLQNLFMAREGDGDDGPPVLEFVWGRRVFGPCVIQNVQVREKAWDKGILVNAEVSFDLEQVPEWTINDGFVDVLRPGRQPMVNDPYVSSESYRDVSTGEEDPPINTDGGKKQETVLTIKNCQAFYSDSKAWSNLISVISKNREGVYTSFFRAIIEGSSTAIKDSFPDNYIKYNLLRKKAQSNSFYRESVKTIPNICQDPEPLKYTFDRSNATTRSETKRINSHLNDSLLKCSKSIKSIIERNFKQSGCDKYSIEPGEQGPRLF